MHTASSMVAALLQLLVANVLTDCFVLCNCGAILLQSTDHRHQCCLPADVGASSVVNLSITMPMIRRDSLGGSAFFNHVNGCLSAQPAFSLLLQRSGHRWTAELVMSLCTWKTTFSPSFICGATRQRQFRTDRTRVADGRAVLLLLCCWPSGARGLLLWLLLLLELVVVLLVVLKGWASSCNLLSKDHLLLSV